jgi:hypothetical protein
MYVRTKGNRGKRGREQWQLNVPKAEYVIVPELTWIYWGWFFDRREILEDKNHQVN